MGCFMRYFVLIFFSSIQLFAQNNFIDDVEERFYRQLQNQVLSQSDQPEMPFSKYLPEIWDQFIRKNFFNNNQFSFAMEVRLFGIPTSDYKNFFYENAAFVNALRHLKTNETFKVQFVNSETGYKQEHEIKLSADNTVLFNLSKELESKSLEFFKEQKKQNPEAIVRIDFNFSLDKYDTQIISPFLFAIESRMKRAVSNFAIKHSGEQYILNSLKNIDFKELPLNRQLHSSHLVKSADKLSEALSLLAFEQEHTINWGQEIIVKARNIAGFISEFKIQGSMIGWDLNNLPHVLRQELSEHKGYYIDKILSIDLPFYNIRYSGMTYFSSILKSPRHTSHYADIVDNRPAILYTQAKDSFHQFQSLPSYKVNLSEATNSRATINFYDNDPNVGRRYTEAAKNDIMKAIHNFSVAPPVDNIALRNCKALFR